MQVSMKAKIAQSCPLIVPVIRLFLHGVRNQLTCSNLVLFRNRSWSKNSRRGPVMLSCCPRMLLISHPLIHPAHAAKLLKGTVLHAEEQNEQHSGTVFPQFFRDTQFFLSGSQEKTIKTTVLSSLHLVQCSMNCSCQWYMKPEPLILKRPSPSCLLWATSTNASLNSSVLLGQSDVIFALATLHS